jgi:hypothetical protein
MDAKHIKEQISPNHKCLFIFQLQCNTIPAIQMYRRLNMKKITVFAVSLLLMATALTACGGRGNVSDETNGKITEGTTTSTIMPTTRPTTEAEIPSTSSQRETERPTTQESSSTENQSTTHTSEPTGTESGNAPSGEENGSASEGGRGRVGTGMMGGNGTMGGRSHF